MADLTREGPRSGGEYDSERDIEAFWAEIKPRREPMQQIWFLPLILLLLAVSIPWYRKPGEIGAIVAGLPVWVWVALIASALVAAVTAVMSIFFWDDDEADERTDAGGDGTSDSTGGKP
jgi:hypothetical protein